MTAEEETIPGPTELDGSTTLSDPMAEGLEVMTSAVRYREALARLALPWLGEDPVEVGAGTGDYAATWADWGKRLVATEPEGPSLAHLRARFEADPRVQVRALGLPSDESAGHSAAVALNVLEHIEDDLGGLRSMARLVRDGGHVVLIVPAFSFAYGDWDRRIGHYRRYRVPEVRAKLEAAGLEPLVVRYIQSVGLIGWCIVIRLLHGEPKDTAALRLYDRFVVPVIGAVERRVKIPFGQSVFAVARVGTEQAPPTA
ncbi:MAG: class I SAM-dependent methyltransferase [Acidimicrobiaceae bacterium]|nr:class I SAM-dependent methyltransferase [Acidimicrobiaceae bacterium]